MSEIREHIVGQVHFRCYRDGNLIYETDSGFVFPVPIDDIGTATFLRDDKAILFMRYIRKFLAALEEQRRIQRDNLGVEGEKAMQELATEAQELGFGY